LDVIYVILTGVFLFWSGQILVVYRRQVKRMEEKIRAAKSSHGETLEQAEEYEERAEELSRELDELKARSETLERTEKTLERELMQFRQREAARNPTRHRVEPGAQSE